jgi:hypothetical protein
MHGVECCGKNPQDAPSFHSYVSSVPEFRVGHKKSLSYSLVYKGI